MFQQDVQGSIEGFLPKYVYVIGYRDRDHSPKLQATPRKENKFSVSKIRGWVGNNGYQRPAWLSNPSNNLCVIVFSVRNPALLTMFVGGRPYMGQPSRVGVRVSSLEILL